MDPAARHRTLQLLGVEVRTTPHHIPGEPYKYKHGWLPLVAGLATGAVHLMSDKDLIEAWHDPELDNPDSTKYTDELRAAIVDEIGKRAGSGEQFRHWQALERKTLANKRRRETARTKRDLERQARADELIAQGASPEDAWAEALGTDAAKLRAWDLVGRRKGESYEQALRRGYGEAVERQLAESEDTVIGYWLSRDGKRALAEAERDAKRNGRTFKFDIADLFSMPEAQATIWASREAQDFWESHGGRLTFEEWRSRVER